MSRAWLRCDGALLIADPAGALVWPEQSLVVVADLHLEKGSALACRGTLLPPYDTCSTLARLENVLLRWRPQRVISLGDGFHDARALARLALEDRCRLAELVAAHDWLWITGNHDPHRHRTWAVDLRKPSRSRLSSCATCRSPARAAPRSPATCTRRRGSRCAAAGCADAASSATTGACSCPRSAAMPAGSMYSTPRSADCSRTASAPRCSGSAACTPCRIIASIGPARSNGTVGDG